MSTKSILSIILEILRGSFVPSDSLDEISLLITWAAWKQRNGQEPKLREAAFLIDSYREMAQDLGDHGLDVERSRLVQRLSESALEELLRHIAAIGNDYKEIARSLCEVSQTIDPRSPTIFLNQGVSQQILELAKYTQAKTAFYHDASLMALCDVKEPDKAIFYSSNVRPVVFAITYLLGVKLVFSAPELIFQPLDTQDANLNASCVVSIPPLGAQITTVEGRIRSEEGALERAINEATDRAVVMVTQAALLSRSAATMREQLVRKNWIQAVISLPQGSLLHTSIPPVLLVIDKHRSDNDKIALYEFTKGEFRADSTPLAEMVDNLEVGSSGVLVDADQIRENDYDLSFGRYKYGSATAALKSASAQPLSHFADIIRAQNLKSEGADASEEGVYLEAGARDIDETGILNTPEKCIRVDDSQLRRAEAQRLQAGDILLAVKGNIGRIALVSENCAHNWIAGQLFVIIRPRSTVSSIYLYRYLSSQLIQAYLAEIETGTAMKVIKAADLQNLPVEVPTQDRSAEVEANFTAIQQEYLAIRQHREKISQCMTELWGHSG